ncbi:hypothetical protein KVR01_007465 [Diaporthe batatas]|uniref:uncharacterized protein n=1 Tax=Diaporthe batatas TaxID=748121 RepID=UPI001D04D3FC|nr:uncharacterized protein KVR01_007465 [Diaporthe batatas]KAG8162987.1 hypothetical protein KVR01_007465 [Diaporthe batatas]
MAMDPGARGSIGDWARRAQEAIGDAVRRLFPDVAAPEDPGPVVSQWRRVPDHEPYMPEWTDPEWSPRVQFSGTGKQQRDVYVTTGETMRPAILRRDEDKNPTDFARRFGIYPKTRPNDPDPAIGRSLVTPTIPRPDQATVGGAYTFGEAEAWQAFVFLGPTTEEMIDRGIYLPDYESNEPGLEGDLHPLLVRGRWTPAERFNWNRFIPDYRWKFGDEEGYYRTDAQGLTFTFGLHVDHDRSDRIAIVIHPSIVWQLLTAEFPEARMATTFNLASTILHELTRARAYIWDPGRRPLILRVQAEKEYYTSRIVHNLWGTIPQIGHWRTDAAGLTPLRPFVVGTSWPSSHLAVDLQHRDVDRSFYAPYATRDYTGFLLEPPAPVFDQDRPIPIVDYARFSHESFWHNQFAKYGHQALKLFPAPDALVILHPRGNRLLRTEIIRELGDEDYRYFGTKVLPMLRNLQQTLLADWLTLETNDLVLEQVTHHRLHYEARTWIRTYGDIIAILDRTIFDINRIGGEMTLRTSQYRQNLLSADTQQTIKTQLQQTITDFVSDDLLESDRLLILSIQYAQSLIAMYTLLPQASERQAVHQRHMRPLRRHLTLVRDRLAACIETLDAYVDAAAATAPGGTDSGNFMAAEAQVLAGYARQAAQNAQVCAASLRDTIALLADDLVAPGLDYAARPGALPHVPQLRKRAATREVYRRAAVRPLAYLRAADRSRASIAVTKWLAVLARHRGDKEGGLEDYPVDLGAVDADASPPRSFHTARESSRPSSGSTPVIPGGFPVSP